MPSKVFLSLMMKLRRNCGSVGACPSVRHNMPRAVRTQLTHKFRRMMQVIVAFLQFKTLISEKGNSEFCLKSFLHLNA